MELMASNIGLERGGRRLLESVSMALAPGRLTVLVGPNGAGKSTLMRVLAGLESPDHGSVRLGDRDVATLAGKQRARLIAHLPQSADIGWAVCGRDVVALGRLAHSGAMSGFDAGSADILAIERALDRTGTAAFADRRVDRLSQGERARLLLARVLAQETGILLLDEPVASLDPAQALAMMEMLSTEAMQGKAVTVVMHDLLLAQRFASHAALLHRGSIVAQGQAHEVFVEPALENAYGVTMRRAEIDGQSLLLPWHRAVSSKVDGRQ